MDDKKATAIVDFLNKEFNGATGEMFTVNVYSTIGNMHVKNFELTHTKSGQSARFGVIYDETQNPWVPIEIVPKD